MCVCVCVRTRLSAWGWLTRNQDVDNRGPLLPSWNSALHKDGRHLWPSTEEPDSFTGAAASLPSEEVGRFWALSSHVRLFLISDALPEDVAAPSAAAVERAVSSLQLKQFLHIARPISIVNCLLTAKQKRQVRVSRRVMPGNGNEFPRKPVLVVVSELLNRLNC